MTKSLRILEQNSQERADKIALTVPGGELNLSYAQLTDAIIKTAESIQPVVAGWPKNRPIALSFSNCPEFVVSFLALAWCGIPAMPLNPALTADLAAEPLADEQPGALITAPGPSALREAATRVGVPCWTMHPDFRIDGMPEGGKARNTAPGPDSIALLLQTSGTTGKPKWVPLTHANLLASISNITTTYKLSPDDSTLLVMPLFHVHGLVAALLATLYSGGRVILAPRFSASHFVEWTLAERPTWYTAVPSIHQILLGQPELQNIPKGQFRFIRSCSSFLAPETLTRIEELLGTPLLEAYGMTEAAHQIASNPLPPGDRVVGSVGQATGVEVAILGTGGDILGPGKKGELAVRGENVMNGYLDNPEANASTFCNGYLRTGDLGEIDANGYIRLLGRLKELINRGGEKISPAQIDDVLLNITGVEKAAAFGVPDTIYGEVVHAAVVQNGALDEAEILDRCREKLPRFMVPVKIHIVTELPLGPSGKVNRNTLPKALGLA
ncbi:MAG TPA: AMP-binding protein [Gammaproteobacteria bacterium]|nr:AMP-binding protein [Gammaproteobacteria bacterium]